jgi:hypothetical protein
LASAAATPLEAEAARLREVDESVARLAAVVEKLAAIAAASGVTAQLVASSTLQGVLHELRAEQRRQGAALRHQREAAALMARRSAAAGNGGGAGQASATDLLLRERGALVGSHSAVDEVLRSAGETQAALARQRAAVQGASGRLGALAARVPILGDLVGAIQRKRSRSDYIVAAVMAACMLFTAWYFFR